MMLESFKFVDALSFGANNLNAALNFRSKRTKSITERKQQTEQKTQLDRITNDEADRWLVERHCR